jgi:hypothetical protein
MYIATPPAAPRPTAVPAPHPPTARMTGLRPPGISPCSRTTPSLPSLPNAQRPSTASWCMPSRSTRMRSGTRACEKYLSARTTRCLPPGDRRSVCRSGEGRRQARAKALWTSSCRTGVPDKKSVWAFGGVGQAYDIAASAAGSVLPSGMDINMQVLNRGVPNTADSHPRPPPGVWRSSPPRQAHQEEGPGHDAMSYGYIYVSRFYGRRSQPTSRPPRGRGLSRPLVVICYAPSTAHGIPHV